MPNRDVIRSQKAAEAVVVAAETNLTLVTEDLQRRLSVLGIDPGIPSEPPVDEPLDGPVTALAAEPSLDVEALQRFSAHAIARARDRLVQADDRLDQERLGDEEPRLRRDEAAGRLYDELVRTRRSLTEAVGPGAAARIFGIQGRTPQDPVVLLRVVQRMVPQLEDPATHFPELLVDGMAQDWAVLAEGLRREAEPLVEAVRAVNEERRRAELALEARDEALDEFRDIYVGFTRILDGVYVASGHRSLARRLRPTIPRGSAIAEDEGSPPDDSVDVDGVPVEDDAPLPEPVNDGELPDEADAGAA